MDLLVKWFRHVMAGVIFGASVVSGTARHAHGQEAGVVTNPPLPRGAADDLEARMRARRAATGVGEAPDVTPPVPPDRGGRGIPASRGFAGSGGFGGGFTQTDRLADEAHREAKKSAPVILTNDANRIEISDKVITVIVPLRFANAVSARMDLTLQLALEADCSANAHSNSLVITDTAAHIHHLLQILKTWDELAESRGMTPEARGGRGGGPALVAPPTPQGTARPAPFPAADGVLTAQVRVFSPSVEILAPVDGTLVQDVTALGRHVKRGDVMFKFDTTELEADIAVAQARVALAKLKLERATAAAKAGIGPATDAEDLKLEVSGEQAILAGKMAELAAHSILAPFEGEVTFSSNGALGRYHTRGTVLCHLTVVNTLQLGFDVVARDAPRLHVGQKIELTMDSIQGKVLAGEITFISPVVEHTVGVDGLSPNAKPVDVEAVAVQGKIVGDAGGVMSGMMGRVRIDVGK